ncbi:MAG TPA: class I tRNA ligase family protein [Candidatus Saccharimonadales bacterium]|nr:class I tRNA ligase family protein [Candidatus Saccharimonadales bacterium]
MKRYNPTEIEQKWQDQWEKDGTYTVDLSDQSRPKYFGFSMLPGITGAGIHIGHGRTYQFSDIKVRAKRQQGFNAYHPIGWDSFGLPVENYAIKVGKTPREAHDDAKVNFKRQLKRLGYSYDWSKEISTADPEYYKWTQWIFNQLYKHDLAYQKESPQWWCETDQTVLANEQVEGGKCWRCGNPVVKKNLKQWFFKITDYADEILEATDALDWTESVKVMQKNWIGKSEGSEIDFMLQFDNEKRNEWRDEDGNPAHITVFTTRPDTIFGATCLVLAPEHPWVTAALEQTDTLPGMEHVRAYVKQAAAKSEIERMNDTREKTGVFTGVHAINPATGKKIPVWVADYVLAGYGTGAIMAVPAHDERDFAFADKFKIPIVDVVAQDFGEELPEPKEVEGVVVIGYDPKTKQFMGLKNRRNDRGWLVAGGREDGETFEQAAYRELREEAGFVEVEAMIPLGAPVYSYYYNSNKQSNRRSKGYNFLAIVDANNQGETAQEAHEDFEVYWDTIDGLRRQTNPDGGAGHWMEGIDRAAQAAKAYDANEAYQARLYHGEGILVNSGEFDGMRTEEAREHITAWLEQQGIGRLKTTYKMRDWLISRQRYWGAPIPIIHCEKDGAVAVPDDQLPVILPEVEDYRPKGGTTSVLAGVEAWVNTTCPTCGGPAKRETDTMDGYACSSWYPLRYLDPFNDKQAWNPEVESYWGPVDFYNGADHAVAHLLYARFWTRFFYKLGLVSHPEPFKRMMYNAYIMAPDGLKMSKSKGNVIDPLEIMNSGYGADSLRIYEMFIAPYDMEAPWDTRGVPGTYRFLNRVWNLVQEYIEAGDVIVDEKHTEAILKTAHHTVKKVTEDIEGEKFNTAVSSMMEAVNTYYKLKEESPLGVSVAWTFAIESLLKVLAPFAPHITEELWHQLGNNTTIHIDTWPRWNNSYLTTSEMTIVVQVNGKVRAKLTLPIESSEGEVKQKALDEENVQKFTDGKEPKKVIYIPGKLVSIVL